MVDNATEPRRGRGRPKMRLWTPEELAERLESTPALIRGLCRLDVFRGAQQRDGDWRVPETAVAALLGDRRPRAFSFSTVAGLLDCSTRTVKRRVQDGAIRAVLVPSIGPRVPETEVLRLISGAPLSFFGGSNHAG